MEKEKFSKKFGDVIFSKQSEINNLKEIIQKKDEEIQKQKEVVWATRMAQHKGRDGKGEKKIESKTVSQETSTPQAITEDPDFLNQFKKLRKRSRLLKEQIQSEKRINRRLMEEREELVRELKRFRHQTDISENLKSRIENLKAQLNQAKATSMISGEATQNLILEKNALIRKYEIMLYGDMPPGQRETAPTGIIQELKNEVEELQTEKNNVLLEMETLKEDNFELESKIHLMEEQKESPEPSEYWSNAQSRGAVAAEFSTGLENFLLTYSDMITLLLVIFVLIYSASKVDEEKFAEALSSFQEKEFQVNNFNVRLNKNEMNMLKRVRELVKDNVDPESLVRGDVRTILIRLKSSDIFFPGDAALIDGADALILDSIREEMKEGVKQVLVDGHTDDVPIHNSKKFPSNWELSSARASMVARVIIDQLRFPPDRVVVTGYGPYRPLKPNNSDKNRAYNRRVEIKILKDKKVAAQEENEKKKTQTNSKNAKVNAVPAPPIPAAKEIPTQNP